MISEKSIIEQSPDLLISVIDNEAVILGIDNGKYIGLNEMGTEIWSMLSQPTKVSKLISALAELYSERDSIIKEHVIEFLSNLLDKSMIRLVDEGNN